MSPDSISAGSRHSILDLAPLELDCMNALWPLGEATVRQVQDTLRPTRPRAYTTIMTILDRLSHKGIVERRKVGRAWVYRASVSADEARTHAISQVVEGFFGGSTGALATHLSARTASGVEVRPLAGASTPIEITISERPSEQRGEPRIVERRAGQPAIVRAAPGESSEPPANLDASLL